MNHVLAWMVALGVQLDDHQPDARLRAHLAATREAKAHNRHASSPLTRLARRIGLEPPRATIEPATCACTA